jgi:hypothetical protein
MSSESARMNTATETRFRTAQNPTGRVVRVINLDTADNRDISRLIEQVPAADLVVMIVTAGNSAKAAATIGAVCSDRRVMTETIVIRAGSVTDEGLSQTLAEVRPWSLMLVVANENDYVEDVLTSFR